MRIGLLTVSLFPLAACMVTPSGQPGTGEPVQTCRNEALAQFTGQPATPGTWRSDAGRDSGRGSSAGLRTA